MSASFVHISKVHLVSPSRRIVPTLPPKRDGVCRPLAVQRAAPGWCLPIHPVRNRDSPFVKVPLEPLRDSILPIQKEWQKLRTAGQRDIEPTSCIL